MIFESISHTCSISRRSLFFTIVFQTINLFTDRLAENQQYLSTSKTWQQCWKVVFFLLRKYACSFSCFLFHFAKFFVTWRRAEKIVSQKAFRINQKRWAQNKTQKGFQLRVSWENIFKACAPFSLEKTNVNTFYLKARRSSQNDAFKDVMRALRAIKFGNTFENLGVWRALKE